MLSVKPLVHQFAMLDLSLDFSLNISSDFSLNFSLNISLDLSMVDEVTEQHAIEDAQSLLTITFLFTPECSSWQYYYDRYYFPGSKLQYNEQSVTEHYTNWNTKFLFETKLVQGQDCTCH